LDCRPSRTRTNSSTSLVLSVSLSLSLSLSFMLRPTFSRPVCLGVKHPSGAHDQIFISQTVAGFLMRDVLYDERTGLSFTIAADPRQRSYSRVGVLWDTIQNVDAEM
jgi:hypothetical protein